MSHTDVLVKQYRHNASNFIQRLLHAVWCKSGCSTRYHNSHSAKAGRVVIFLFNTARYHLEMNIAIFLPRDQ